MRVAMQESAHAVWVVTFVRTDIARMVQIFDRVSQIAAMRLTPRARCDRPLKLFLGVPGNCPGPYAPMPGEF